MLHGLCRADWRRVQQVAMEVHDIYGRLDAAVALLRRHGFRVTCAVQRHVENKLAQPSASWLSLRPAGSAFGQLALRKLLLAPEHASGCPKLRPVSTN